MISNLKGVSNMKKMAMLAALMTAVAVLDGCSAGGTQSKTSSSTTPAPSPGASAPAPAPTAADLVVVAEGNKTTIQDTGADTTTIDVTAVDSNRNIVAGVPVTIVPDSTSNTIITPSGTVTNAAGLVTAVLSIGADHSNRTFNVLVTAGSVTKTIAITVTGAKLTASAVSGSAGATASVAYHLADGAGASLSKMPISVSGDNLPTVNDKTDDNGNYTYTYTVPSTASLTITGVAGGVTTPTTVTISGTTTPIASGTPTAESISANPNFVGINTVGSSANQIQVRALFQDSNNLPISNVRVRFDLAGDANGIGGSLSSGNNYVYTNANGVAATNYIAGQRGSGNNALTIRACWSVSDFDPVQSTNTNPGSCPNSVPLTVSVTVTQGGVSVSKPSTDNILLVDTNKQTYSLPFSIQITDSVGNPQAGIKVSATSYAPRFYRGYWSLPTTSNVYVQNIVNSCDNEDVNNNNNIDAGEDVNGSGKLEPSKADIAIVAKSPGSDTTDASGLAYFLMQYGMSVASWEDYYLTFSATVAGSEGTNFTSGKLPVPFDATVEGNETTPPFENSPYNFLPAGTLFPTVVGLTPVTTTTTPPVTYHLCQKQN